jgi:hypothetical protein
VKWANTATKTGLPSVIWFIFLANAIHFISLPVDFEKDESIVWTIEKCSLIDQSTDTSLYKAVWLWYNYFNLNKLFLLFVLQSADFLMRRRKFKKKIFFDIFYVVLPPSLSLARLRKTVFFKLQYWVCFLPLVYLGIPRNWHLWLTQQTIFLSEKHVQLNQCLRERWCLRSSFVLECWNYLEIFVSIFLVRKLSFLRARENYSINNHILSIKIGLALF